MEAATRESRAGRAVRHLLLPLSIAEVADELPGTRALADLHYAQITRRMLTYGGYPPAVLGAQPEQEPARLVEAFVIRDASDRL